jgi:hypothetical protein
MISDNRTRVPPSDWYNYLLNGAATKTGTGLMIARGTLSCERVQLYECAPSELILAAGDEAGLQVPHGFSP